MQNIVKEIGLDDPVIFNGRVPYDQVVRYYSIIDLLVYPRLKMRITDLVTPLKPLEAMAMEKAVLMSDAGGLREPAEIENVAFFFEAETKKTL